MTLVPRAGSYEPSVAWDWGEVLVGIEASFLWRLDPRAQVIAP